MFPEPIRVATTPRACVLVFVPDCLTVLRTIFNRKLTVLFVSRMIGSRRRYGVVDARQCVSTCKVVAS